MKIKPLPWLNSLHSGWIARVESGRIPHAVLLIGPAGTGKRCAAAWMASHQLGIAQSADSGPAYPLQVPTHPDLHWLHPAQDKQTIGVDQIRNLVSELSLTSYEGGAKVAVIEPANAMTASAANGLLKTLEEPAGDSLLILIADRVGQLPATVFSRCQRISVNRPDAAQSMHWLDQVKPGAQWAKALQNAGGAPLRAIQALKQLDDGDALMKDFAAVGARRESPVVAAARWAKLEPAFVLDWLCGQVQRVIQRASGAAPALLITGIDDSVLRRIDRRNLFCYLDMINRLRGQGAGSFNVHLALEGLLIDWAEGLQTVRRPGSLDNAKLTFLNG